ncbi:MAG: hypothetical protein QM523_01000 [Candidatus Pacebacteria bacterium]|nr:hypothetical protein [Candidatus Paceibacterota bacterium]
MEADLDEPEPNDSAYWLDMISDAEAKFQDWQDAADSIDRIYGNLSELRNLSRDRDFQLFWSNVQVMGPSIYARAPVPVVTPKFKDRRPLYRTSAELLERCCIISFDMADIDQHMVALRDDLSIVGRGAAWVRYESDNGDEIFYEHLDRKDFLHEPARKWAEVDWVARRAWMTKEEMKKRFGEVADEVSYEMRRDEKDSLSATSKCGVWELWCKSKNKVVWVTSGCDRTLEEDEPYLKLAGFFPCPRPAFATLQRRTLIPVPDMLFYKDQLEEVNSLTRRIHALADALKVRGFYSGSGDIGGAIERAIALTDDTQILVPVPAMAALMQGAGEPIVWLPLEMVANTITGLIELRRQVIDDVYQIIGLSDIMRGSTVASETLGAQQLKQQNGSYRVRDKQNELVRVARDLVRIGAEIMANEFSRKSLEEMSQIQLPTAAENKKKLKDYEAKARAELEGLMAKAEEMAMQAQQSGEQVDPAQAEAQFQQQQQAVLAKWSKIIDDCREEVTIDAVMEFIKNEKMRPFALDIETDSTIYPDEMAEKNSRQEFMVAFSSTMQSLMPLFQLGPQAVALSGGLAKFALSPYRVGRELEGLIDDFADQGPQMAERMQAANGQDDGLSEAQGKLAEAEMQKAQAQMAKVQADTVLKQAEGERKTAEAAAKAQGDQGKLQLEMIKLQQAATDGAIKGKEAQSRVDMMKAQTMKLLTEAGVMLSEQQLNEFNSLADVELRKNGQAMDAAKPAMGLGEPGEAPEGPGEAPKGAGVTTNAVMEGLQMLGQMMAQQSAILAQVASAVSAPKEIVRGPDGRAMGVRTMQ